MTEETKEITFVTRKVLVTFNQPICIIVSGNALYSGAAICEYNEAVGNSTNKWESEYSSPKHLTIVALPDGKKMDKSIKIKVNLGLIIAMVELES